MTATVLQRSPRDGATSMPDEPVAPAASPVAPRLWRSAGAILASQALLGVAGIATLPALARNLGPAGYGDFSLYVTLLGVVVYQDFARQMLVREETLRTASDRERAALARVSTFAIAAIAGAVGPLVLEPASAILLVAAAVAHGLASRDWARISAAGRLALPNAARNCAWAAAFAGTTALSFVATGPWVYAAPFLAANLALYVLYRRCAPPREVGEVGARRASWLGWDELTASPHFRRYRREALDLVGFTVAASVMVAADRVLLDLCATAEELGRYAAHSDLALKVNVIGTALAGALYPLHVRELRDDGAERATRRAIRVASAAVPAYFVLLALLIATEKPLLGLLLGPEFARGTPLFALFLVGMFVQLFGFLITPWQRARGDFASQRRAYQHGAIATVAVGAVCVPWLGAPGAFAAFACSRLAEVELLWVEARRTPRAWLPRWKLAAAGAMLAALALLAAWTLSRGGVA